ncbi:hypothetical protein [Yeosuana marina]|uniref:hypothetical protein n=1 Tax=Yeosuana marina TaxID=1565536 RepID=UPI0014222942|nr:hypothetical protein [Yeosuana marina]
MKTIRNIIVIIIIVLGAMCLAHAQEKTTISVFQDAKLLVAGDNKGNKALTPNIITRLNMQGNQQKWGYMTVFPEFEYAQLKGGNYIRYSANLGYTFNKLVIKNTEAGAFAGWGWIDRENFTYHSWSFSGVVNYKISNAFKICSMVQITQRNDLEIPVFRTSGFVGLEISIY